MEKRIKPCECGSTEFVTEPNQYDIYEIIDDELIMVDTTAIYDGSYEFKLYCLRCGEELKDAEDYL